MNSAVTNIYGLLSWRTIIIILVKDHKTTSQAGARKRRHRGSHYEGDLGFPPLPDAPTHRHGTARHGTRAGSAGSTTGLKRAVSGHSDYKEPVGAAALKRRQTSLFYPGLYFSHGLWKGCDQVICVGLLPGTGAEQVPRGGENPPSVYLLKGSFNSSPRIALGRAETTSLAGCRESECEKVSQAEEKGGKKKLQVLRQNTFFFSFSCSLLFVALNQTCKPFRYLKTKGTLTRCIIYFIA